MLEITWGVSIFAKVPKPQNSVNIQKYNQNGIVRVYLKQVFPLMLSYYKMKFMVKSL